MRHLDKQLSGETLATLAAYAMLSNKIQISTETPQILIEN